jgi:hypothetical protein
MSFVFLLYPTTLCIVIISAFLANINFPSNIVAIPIASVGSVTNGAFKRRFTPPECRAFKQVVPQLSKQGKFARDF